MLKTIIIYTRKVIKIIPTSSKKGKRSKLQIIVTIKIKVKLIFSIEA